MRIGIDLRLAGTGEGIGRYTEELVTHLMKLDTSNEYFLLVSKIFNFQFSIFNPNFKIVRVRSGYYSFLEQTYFIWELLRLRLDMMHFTSFNIPILYPGKFVVTIHDVIHHQFPGRKKSRLLHRLAYRLVILTAIRRAKKIITVSQTAKHDIVNTFQINPEKLQVIYEAAAGKFVDVSGDEAEVTARYNIAKPFLLCVGVWRQYKNLPRLAAAFDIMKEKYRIDCQLVLAGKIDPHYPEIKQAVFAIKNSADIKALGFVSDEDLAWLYRAAKIFVLPSLVEGFGLIGVEAQAAGAAVAASDIPVLREILGRGAEYFDPSSADSMAEKIAAIWLDERRAQTLRAAAVSNAERFSWQTCARETLDLYHSLA